MIRQIIRISALIVAGTTLIACGDMPQNLASASASTSGPQDGEASAQTNITSSSTGVVRFGAPASNSITALTTTLTVPPPPPAEGTLFLWPGLQPGGANFAPINNGVLQPVLTWGPSCAPGTLGNDHSSWWISAEYVNLGSAPGFTGCQGGERIAVQPGDALHISMTLDGNTWTQTVVAPEGTVSFVKDLQGQSQNFAYFVIEEDGQKPVSDVTFTDTTLQFAAPFTSGCAPQQVGSRDDITQSVPNANNTACSIATMTLRPDAS